MPKDITVDDDVHLDKVYHGAEKMIALHIPVQCSADFSSCLGYQKIV